MELFETTSRKEVVPEKLTVSQLIKKLHAFYTTRKFINVFKKARN